MVKFLALVAVAAFLHAQPKFEVASVKPVDQNWFEVKPRRAGDKLTFKTDLWHMVVYAYHMDRWRISGPLPGSKSIYAIDALVPPSATDDEVRAMVRSLLADRFKMVARRVTKEGDGFALIVAASGPKIHEAKPDDPPPPLPEWFAKVPPAQLEGKIPATVPGKGVTAITGRRVSMAQFAETLESVLQVRVIDKTNLSGNYYFALTFAGEDAPADTDAPSLFAAVQKLGLKLEKQKLPVEMLVIDSIEKVPTEN